MARRKYPALSPEAIVALREYAAKHGICWKLRLSEDWMRASAPAVLHALRNSHGPAWLERFKLPKET
jgi:hypothetical protein